MRCRLLSIIVVCVASTGCAQLNNVATSVSNVALSVGNVASTMSTRVTTTLGNLNLRAYLPPEGLIADAEQQKALHRHFAERQAQIEQRAANGEITWVQAAREVRNLHRRSGWDFERVDEEFHTYNTSLAEQLDAGRLTYAQYDALRTQRFNEIERRRLK
jgi:hypothetical protein